MEEQQKYRFTIKCDGENYIPLKTLCGILDGFDTLSDLAVDKGPKCEYQICAYQKGSFMTEIVGKAAVPASLFYLQNANYILDILEIMKEWLQLMVHLKGKKAKSIEPKGNKMEVVNEGGSVIQVSFDGATMFENANVEIKQAVFQIGNSLKDGNVKGFSFLDEQGKPIVKIPKEDFDYLSGNAVTTEESYKVVNKRMVLPVRQWVSRGRGKWLFSNGLGGRAIAAKMMDETWLNSFQSGSLNVKSGDCLEVDLRIEIPENSNGILDKENARYMVMHVYQLVHEEEYEDQTLD